MSDLTFDRLRATNVQRCEQVFHPLKSWSYNDWGTAMGGECGEALTVLKKIRRGDLQDPTVSTQAKVQLGHELADIIIYADLLAASAGIDLGEMVTEKFNQVSTKRGASFFL